MTINGIAAQPAPVFLSARTTAPGGGVGRLVVQR